MTVRRAGQGFWSVGAAGRDRRAGYSTDRCCENQFAALRSIAQSPAQGAGRHAEHSCENPRQMTLIRKTAIQGDQADGHLTADEHLLGAIDPLYQQPSMYDAVRRLLEPAGSIVTWSLVGKFVTSLDMADCSATVSMLDEEMSPRKCPHHQPCPRWLGKAAPQSSKTLLSDHLRITRPLGSQQISLIRGAALVLAFDVLKADAGPRGRPRAGVVIGRALRIIRSRRAGRCRRRSRP
jgi:hypothetical protein